MVTIAISSRHVFGNGGNLFSSTSPFICILKTIFNIHRVFGFPIFGPSSLGLFGVPFKRVRERKTTPFEFGAALFVVSRLHSKGANVLEIS